jgi:RNA polymerase sigma factor (sigma-70 family)
MSATYADNTTAASVPLSDLVLVDRVRAGDEAAFGELWLRHNDAGLRAARKITRRFDPEDLVQEAFTRVLAAIRRGNGPRDAFRPYLYSAIRRISMNWTRDEVVASPLEDLGSEMDPDAIFEDAALERTLTGRAYASLRPEWRAILWYTEVEGVPARETGQFLGLSANAAAALAYRAREGLRIAWLQAHVNDNDIELSCRWTVERLGPFKRRSLGVRDRDTVETHLTTCLRCSILAEELDDVAQSLKVVVLPLVVGAGILSLGALPTGATTALLAGSSSEAGATGAGATVVGGAATGTGATVAPLAGLASLTSLTAVIATVSVVVGITVAAGLGSHDGGVPSAPTTPHALVQAQERSASPTTQDEGSDARDVTPDTDATPPTDVEQAPPVDTTLDSTPPPSDSPTSPAPPTGETSDPPSPPESEAPADPRTDAPPVVDATTDHPPSPAPPAAAPSAPTIHGTQEDDLFLPVLHGTADPGAQVIVESADGDVLASTQANPGGQWTARPTLDDAPSSALFLRARQTTASGSSAASDLIGPFVLEGPTIVHLDDGVPFPTVTFSGRPGSVVEALIDDVPTGNLHTLGHKPLVRRIADVGPGQHRITVRYTDPATGQVGASRTATFTVTEQFPHG